MSALIAQQTRQIGVMKSDEVYGCYRWQFDSHVHGGGARL